MMQKIASYKPAGNPRGWPRVAPFVRGTVAAAEPQASSKITGLMTALTHVALFVEAEKTRQAGEVEQARNAFAARRGHQRTYGGEREKAGERNEPNPAEWLAVETIERFIEGGLLGIGTATRSSYRRRLMQLRDAVFGKDPVTGQPVKLSDANTYRPYTRAEQKEMWYWAHNQPTRRREVACKVLLCLGLGCGLEPAEIRQVRVHDVRVSGNGAVVVHVRGPRARVVLCRHGWEGALTELVSAMAGQAAWLFQPAVDRRDASLVSSLVSRARKAPGAPAVKVKRMRTTWLVDLVESRVALTTIVTAAGLDSLNALSPVLPFIASADAPEAERQLRGLEP